MAWWDFAFKALKNGDAASLEENVAIAKVQAGNFLKDDGIRP